MEGLKITVYFPKVYCYRGCTWEYDRVLLGWNVPVLNSTVVVASYPSHQKADVVNYLRKLLRMPGLRHIFRQHGKLSLLEGFSLKRNQEGYYIERNDGQTAYVQLVRYANEDFGVISFDELLSMASQTEGYQTKTSGKPPSNIRISSYLVAGRALCEYIEQELENKASESQCSHDGETRNMAKNPGGKDLQIAKSLYCKAYIWFWTMILCMSNLAQVIVNTTSRWLSHSLTCWLRKIATVAILSDRICQLAQLKDMHNRLRQCPDVLEYIALRHDLRQSLISLMLDVAVGALELIFFRHLLFYSVNKVRLVLRTTYVSTLKYMTYQFTMRIGKYCKVNNEVAVFLSRLMLSKIIVWNVVKPRLKRYLFIASVVFKYSVLLGFSCQIAVLVDVMNIQTMHITYGHCTLYYITICTRNYLFSLLQLFKGKKWNELKGSLDSNKYTREQLFLGTVIFALLLLIYPTIWIFYFVTWVVYLPIVVTRAAIKAVIKVITSMPSYYIMYNIFFLNRYKKDIYFIYDEENEALDYMLSHHQIKEAESDTDREITAVVAQRLMDVRCSQFPVRTIMEPMIDGVTSCFAGQFSWKPF